MRTGEMSGPSTISTPHVKLDEPSRRQRTGGFALPGLARWMVAIYPRAVGAMLVLAASLKVWDPTGVRQVLEFNGLAESLLPAAVWIVILTEAAIGLLLILRPKVGWVLDLALILLSLYTLQLAYLASFQQAPSCACLTAWQSYHSARFENLMGIGRNVCLVLALLWVRWQVPPRTVTHT